MHIKGLRILPVFVAIWLAGPLAKAIMAAEAWMQPDGGIYLKVSTGYLRTDEEFDFEGKRQPIFAENLTLSDASFEEFSFTTYLEYGVTDRFTVVARLPYKILRTKETQTPIFGATPRRITRTNGNFSDLSVSIRTPLLRAPIALAVQTGLKIPLGYVQFPSDVPALGTGDVDWELIISYGQSFFPLPLYLSAAVGFRVRGGPLHDELVYSVESGYTYGPLFAKLRFDGLQSTIDPPDIAGQPVVQPGVVNTVVVGDQDVFKLISELNLSVTNTIALSGEIFYTLAGKNTVTGTTYSLGLVLSL